MAMLFRQWVGGLYGIRRLTQAVRLACQRALGTHLVRETSPTAEDLRLAISLAERITGRSREQEARSRASCFLRRLVQIPG